MVLCAFEAWTLVANLDVLVMSAQLALLVILFWILVANLDVPVMLAQHQLIINNNYFGPRKMLQPYLSPHWLNELIL